MVWSVQHLVQGPFTIPFFLGVRFRIFAGGDIMTNYSDPDVTVFVASTRPTSNGSASWSWELTYNPKP